MCSVHIHFTFHLTQCSNFGHTQFLNYIHVETSWVLAVPPTVEKPCPCLVTPEEKHQMRQILIYLCKILLPGLVKQVFFPIQVIMLNVRARKFS